MAFPMKKGDRFESYMASAKKNMGAMEPEESEETPETPPHAEPKGELSPAQTKLLEQVKAEMAKSPEFTEAIKAC
jgi:hypothetical protein